MSQAFQSAAGPSSALTPPPDGDAHFAMKAPMTSGGIISCCSDCGNDVVHPHLKDLQEAQIRIAEMDEQIRILTLRATSAMEKATEYETSLKRMNSLSSAGRSTPEPGFDNRRSASPASRPRTPSVDPASPERSGSRLARLLPTRMPSLRSAASSPSIAAAAAAASSSPLSRVQSKSQSRQSETASTPIDSTPSSAVTPVQAPTQFPMLAHTPPTPTVDASALLSQLSKEQKLRQAAEAEATKTKSEIEELTGQLFEQANQMVATERKARARLEARVEVLERRDGEKARRLGMLETRIQRVERVRGLLAESRASSAGSDISKPAITEKMTVPRKAVGVGA